MQIPIGGRQNEQNLLEAVGVVGVLEQRNVSEVDEASAKGCIGGI
jgi:hypothetical protein